MCAACASSIGATKACPLTEANKDTKGDAKVTYRPWQTFCSVVPMKGANGQPTQRSLTP